MPPIDPHRKPDPKPRATARPPAAKPTDAAPPLPARDTYVRRAAPPPGPRWSFRPDTVRGTYDARADRTPTYDFPAIIAQVPATWDRKVSQDLRPDVRRRSTTLRPQETYGELFGRIGEAMGVDPFALAAFCVFESYDARRGSFNPQMREAAAGMLAAGIAATQAQDWRGKRVPGLPIRFPRDQEATASLLRANPEYGLRCLAAELKHRYEQSRDLAAAFPKTAFPAWGDPRIKRGNYGDVAQYVSRAHALYEAFSAAAARKCVDLERP